MFQESSDAGLKITIAWIGIIGSILTAIVALVSAILTRQTSRQNQRDLEKHQRKLEALKSSLEEQKSEKAARRDYEYDARRRLYQQCEPLLFQLVELSERASDRIRGLARTSKQGDLSLKEGQGWLRNENSYYLRSTFFYLFSPLVIYRLIQRRLTLVDLTLVPHINAQYMLAKQLYISFTDDFELAKTLPEIDYRPNAEVSVRAWKKNPEIYARQCIFTGYLDSLVNGLIRSEADGTPRCITFGEFESTFNEKSKEAALFDGAAYLFLNFHPKSRPVLWRILIAQAHIYEALVRSRELKSSDSGEMTRILLPIPEQDRAQFDWRSNEANDSDDNVLVEPFEVAIVYLRKHLPSLF